MELRKQQKVHRTAASWVHYLKKRANVHVKAQIGKAGGHHFGPSVVTVLSHLGHQDAGPTPFLLLELLHHGEVNEHQRF